MYIHIVENVKASQSKTKYIHPTSYAPPAGLVCVFWGSHITYTLAKVRLNVKYFLLHFTFAK